MLIVILAGHMFGRLTVIREVERDASGSRRFECRCSCGKIISTRASRLVNGKTCSCGCLVAESMSRIATTHGQSQKMPRTYRIWLGIVGRCTQPTHTAYKYYGGKGITICPEWKASYENFRRDVGDCPSELHSIDRRESNGNYEPGNVRWATKQEQANNTSRNRLITVDGKTQTLSDWSRETGTKPSTIRMRLTNGWDAARAVS